MALAAHSHRDRAAALRAVAAALESQRPGIIAHTSKETHLTPEELAPEFDRMVGTLRLFAATIKDGSFFEVASTDSSEPSIGPPHTLRAVRIPVGTVLVFGASNFPLSYGVCGGDTASAFAAGCPVVVKEHPAHPKTGRLLHSLAREALSNQGFEGWLRYVRHTDPADLSVAATWVKDPGIAAVGFTGSVKGGLAIEKLAQRRDVPIPVFAEMGSLNPVIVTPRALRARGPAIARLLYASIGMRVGQQCTKPGIIFVEEGDDVKDFVGELIDRMAQRPTRRMVAPWVERSFQTRVNSVSRVSGVTSHGSGSVRGGSKRHWLFDCALASLNRTRTLREEIFGPAVVIVRVPNGTLRLDTDSLSAMLGRLPGNLTCTLHAERAEITGETWRLLAPSAGRIILNGVPTGVRVHDAMVHSGPYPACNRPESTAVGTRAIGRWTRSVCVQTASR